MLGMDELRKRSLPFFFFFIISLIIHVVSAATDAINSSQIITDGETLVSSGGKFEFGFFSPGNSTNRFVGIWYKNITVRTYVWVANRQAPLMTKSGVLKVTEPGILALFNHTNGTIVWWSNATRTVGNPVAQLLQTGNLVVKDANDDRPENFAWQSFDYPSDSLLPGMRYGWNLVTGVETYFTSWRSSDDPAPGEFSVRLSPIGYPQIFLQRGNAARFRIGPWNGLLFSGATAIIYRSSIDPVSLYRSLVMSKNEVKFQEDTSDPSLVTRAVVTADGFADRRIWSRQTQAWESYRFIGVDDCDSYNLCGANGVCDIGKSPHCGCLDRFVPREQDTSNGCVPGKPLTCQDDVFLKSAGIKLPDARNSTYTNRSMSLAECEVECSRNCSCTAYTQLDIRQDRSGCLFYFGDLIDIRTVPQGGQDLFVRMTSIELSSKGKKRVIFIATFTSVAGVVLVCIGLVLIWRRKRKNDHNRRGKGPVDGIHGKEVELPFFNLSTILKSTNNFSDKNKLGQGGFGPVYRGMLEDGQEIAVKRLSKTSSQGVDELKNEVILITKLQHRNLVKTLGCCVEGEENMLVYEYMPNNSLDFILFDKVKSMQLDWEKRFRIINGIAKGLLYLHQDSRLRIIHRDLKASNVLLDAEMNPKISDFGLARSFGGNETEARTSRVVGTYGYMSPEYAIDGLFSIKSDVFSFGVLVLEIVSGKRNRGFSNGDHNLNLLGHAWTLHKEDKSSKLVDPSLGSSYDLSEVLRSIHVGLLCVQKKPEDRPNMSSVVFMLGNEVALPQVKPPGFFTERDISVSKGFSTINAFSENQMTITLPEGR